jgi:DNA-binding HxlR family transcriptional regulator
VGTKADANDLDWRSLCPVACCLDVLGDRWSLLIVRDLIIHETRTDSEFRGSLEHVTTNILAHRLRLLTSLGIIERTNPEGAARTTAYRLTPSGAAPRLALKEFAKWAQTYLKPRHSDMVNSV